MNPYQGLMNKNVPMVCGGLGSTLSIKKKCYYLGKYDPTNRNVITLQRNTLDHHYEQDIIWGGTKKQTNKLEHTQTNSPSMHFICENTN